MATFSPSLMVVPLTETRRLIPSGVFGDEVIVVVLRWPRPGFVVVRVEMIVVVPC